MCEFSANLVAYLDGELVPHAAAEVQQHLAECAQCRNCAAEFQRVSGEFQNYCNEVLQAREQFALRRWAPVLCGAAAAAALLALVMSWPRTRIVQQTPASQTIARATAGPSLPADVANNSLRADTLRTSVQRTGKLHRPRGAKVGASRRDELANVSVRAAQSASKSAASPQPGAPIAEAAAIANGSAIQVAIPADAMFPPGAMPEGVNFVAEVQLGADGNVRQLQLRPGLVSLQRRSN